MNLVPRKVESKVLVLVLLICLSMALLAARLMLFLQENALLHQAQAHLARTVESQMAYSENEFSDLLVRAENANAEVAKLLFSDTMLALPVEQVNGDATAIFPNAPEQFSLDTANLMTHSRLAMAHIAPIVRSDFLNFYVAIDGEFVCMSPAAQLPDGNAIEKLDIRQKNYVAGPVANPDGSAMWLSPRYDVASGKWVTTVLTPLYEGDQYRGFTGSEYSLVKILTRIREMTATAGFSGTYFFDSKGSLVRSAALGANTDSSHLNANSESTSGEIPIGDVEALIAHHRDRGTDFSDSVYMAFDTSEESYLAQAGPLGVSDWNVAVMTSGQTIRSQVNALRFRLAASATVLALLLVLLLRSTFRQLFMKRIVGLEKATRTFAQLGIADFPEPGNDEIGSLVHAFEEMVESLACREAELTVRNQQLKNEISGRLSAVESLRESERKFRTLFDKSSDAVLLFDDNRFIDCNEAAIQLFGCESKAELLDADPSSFHPDLQPDGQTSALKAERMMSVATNEGKHHYEWMSQNLVGHEFWTDVLMTPIPYGGREVLYTVIRDITARKSEEEERVRLTAAIEQAAEAIIVADAVGMIQYVNPSFEAQTGYLKEVAIGQTIEIFKSDENPPELIESMWETINAGEVWKGRLANKRADDTLYQAETTISPVRDAADNIRNYVIVSYDVTKEATLEAQLIQAQKMEAIGELASGIAHEINTPTQYIGDNVRFFQESFSDVIALLDKYKELHVAVKLNEVEVALAGDIDAYIEEIELDYLKEELPIAIEQALEGNSRVAEIVRAMKEFAHPGLEERTAIDINHSVKNTLAVARNEWKYVADIVMELDPDLPQVPCLPGAFNQVILNIIVNASHAIGDVVNGGADGKGTITITTGSVEGYAEIRIQDTGTGVPEEIRKKIFDPFFTTKVVGKGTGQGLALAHSVIVEKHNGTIAIESEVGKGTTFIIRVPLVELDEEVEVKAPAETAVGV